MGPSHFATGMVLTMPACLVTMWERNVALIFLNCLYEQINAENSKLFEVVETVLITF